MEDGQTRKKIAELVQKTQQSSESVLSVCSSSVKDAENACAKLQADLQEKEAACQCGLENLSALLRRFDEALPTPSLFGSKEENRVIAGVVGKLFRTLEDVVLPLSEAFLAFSSLERAFLPVQKRITEAEENLHYSAAAFKLCNLSADDSFHGWADILTELSSSLHASRERFLDYQSFLVRLLEKQIPTFVSEMQKKSDLLHNGNACLPQSVRRLSADLQSVLRR